MGLHGGTQARVKSSLARQEIGAVGKGGARRGGGGLAGAEGAAGPPKVSSRRVGFASAAYEARHTRVEHAWLRS